jgi:rhodanese-related sulfurtransferase
MGQPFSADRPGVNRESAAPSHPCLPGPTGGPCLPMGWTRSLLKQMVVLILAAMLAAWANSAFHWTWKLPPEVRSLSLPEARKNQGPLLWVDVRDADRFAEAHVPEAVRYDEAHPSASLAQLVPLWTPQSRVLVYGEGPGSERALRVAKQLKKDLASREVYLLEGGWLAWPRE